MTAEENGERLTASDKQNPMSVSASLGDAYDKGPPERRERDVSKDDSVLKEEAGCAAWREIVKIHSATELFPMMNDEEFANLSNDIAIRGLLTGITFRTPASMGTDRPRIGECLLDWGKRKGFDLYLLDGRNRLAAIERISDPEGRRAALDAAFSTSNSRGSPAQLLDRDICPDPLAYVVSANLHRRHLTRAQKQELVEHLLRANPERSNNSTALLAQVSDKTVAAQRQKLEASSEIPKLTCTVGRDGRTRISRDVRKFQPLRKSWAARRDEAVVAFSKTLHARFAATLEDFTMLLRDEAAQIAALSREKRVSLALGYLEAPGISRDDLPAQD